ncbi:MAG: glycosyltransferase [Rhodospirillales bacterium]|nr:glycosyltransferase [Rhodospirillales bacterium]
MELMGYRLFRLPHLVWTYGADVRTREKTMALGYPNCCTDCTQIGKACICDDDKGMRNISRLKRYRSIIFSMGDMMEYVRGSKNDLFFWPLEVKGRHSLAYNTQERLQKSQRGPLRVVHAPNHREFKGTKYLEAAILSLQEEGIEIELVLVQNLTNSEALKVYSTADVVFDQCLIGFHGYFALEAMALGKPVMCYIRKPSEYLLQAEQCPIINTHIDSLKEDLRLLVERRRDLPEIGLNSRRYVERYFSHEAFAERLRQAYRDLGIL